MRFDCIHCRKATTKPQNVKGAFLRMLTFEGRYTDQMTGLIDGVSEGFKNRINPDTGRKFTKTDIKRIIKFCYSGEDSFDYYLKHYNLKGAK